MQRRCHVAAVARGLDGVQVFPVGELRKAMLVTGPCRVDRPPVCKEIRTLITRGPRLRDLASSEAPLIRKGLQPLSTNNSCLSGVSINDIPRG
ncbi:hypothetical protein MTO96_002902 [Rhipicephalus appendiculatus]